MTWRRRAMWAGVVAAVVVVLAWLGSGWYGASISHTTPSRTMALSIGWGCIVGHTYPMAFNRPGLSVQCAEHLPPGRPPHWFWKPSDVFYVLSDEFSIPLWFPFLVIVGATVQLWIRDKRRVPGACVKCGYDLSGTPSGVCPECGAWP